jgi:hypothetical protein
MEWENKLEVFFNTTEGTVLIIALTIWSLVWKSFALWKAAKLDQKKMVRCYFGT